MMPYFFLFTIILMFYIIINRKMIINIGIIKREISGEKATSILVCLFLTLFMGLRAPTVGCDVIQYLNRYNNSQELFNLGTEYSEWGFNYLTYLFHNILNLDFQWFIFFVSTVCCIVLYIIIYHYSKDIILSTIIYLTVGIFTMNMSGLRQTLSISICLISILCVEKRQYIGFAILMFFAYIIHNSAIIFIPVYFLWGVRISKKQGLFLLGLTVMAFFYRPFLSPIISMLSPVRYSKYSLIEGYQINYLVILVPIIFSIYNIFFVEEIDGKISVESSFFYIMTCLNILFTILSLTNGQIGRLAYYFAIGNVITVTYANYYHTTYDRRIALLVKRITRFFDYLFISWQMSV